MKNSQKYGSKSEALEHMLDNDVLVLDFEHAYPALIECACLDLVDMLEPLVQVAQRLTDEEGCTQRTLQVLLDLTLRVRDSCDSDMLLRLAMDTKNRSLVECIYNNFEFGLEDIVAAILDSGSIAGLEVSLEKYPELEDELQDLLQSAMRNKIVNLRELIEYLSELNK
ncbi:Hypothetical protein POVR2_LOCUS6 [uncultured virus]|nr:Hypothetical protein POVR2_LOCUS6 [uncultured virus]